MLELRRTAFRDTNVRRAFTLGTLLALLVAFAVYGTFRIYTQLDSTAALQRSLDQSRAQLNDVIRIQLDEETGLRGYIATNNLSFLEPYLNAKDQFLNSMGQLEAATKDLGIRELVPLFADMKAQHLEWETNVARPLVRNPRAKDSVRRQTLGKIIIDRLRSDANRVRSLLDQRLAAVQNDLKRRINETLGGALVGILVFGVIGIFFVGQRTRMLAQIDRERGIIETLQGAFRTGWDELPGSRIGTAYSSATRDASVGGDLFDIRRLDDMRGLLVVADISGKGVEAAVNTAFVKYSIRALADSEDDPARILMAFNRTFIRTIKNPSLFVVTFVGILDARQLTLTYASAGHPGAYVRRAGHVRQLDITGPIVGLDPAFTYETQVEALTPGDLLFLATDGLTEARDADGNHLDEAGAIRLIERCTGDPQACADGLVAAIRELSGGTLDDDLALLVVSVDGLPAKSSALPLKRGAPAG